MLMEDNMMQDRVTQEQEKEGLYCRSFEIMKKRDIKWNLTRLIGMSPITLFFMKSEN